MVLDIQWHRYFFYPTEMRGTITLNGAVYYSELGYIDENGRPQLGPYENSYRPGTKGGLWTGIKNKLKNEIRKSHFVIYALDQQERMSDVVDLRFAGTDLDAVALWIGRREAPDYVYGPAATADEANAVLERYFKYR